MKGTADRLNTFWTPALLFVFGCLYYAMPFIKPYACLIPENVTKIASSESIELSCWSTGFYLHEKSKPIVYHQNVFYWLLIQAAAVILPYILWKNLSPYSGIDINKIIKSAQEEHKKVAENIEKVANDLTMFMKSRSFAIFYISIKLVGILNCMVELLLIYGLYDMQFPVNVLCDVEISEKNFTIPCVLSANIYIKLTVRSLIIWYTLLFCINVVSTWWVISNTILRRQRKEFILGLLATSDDDIHRQFPKERLSNFAEFLDMDVACLIHMLEKEYSKAFISGLVAKLFRLWHDKYYPYEEQNEDDGDGSENSANENRSGGEATDEANDDGDGGENSANENRSGGEATDEANVNGNQQNGVRGRRNTPPKSRRGRQ